MSTTPKPTAGAPKTLASTVQAPKKSAFKCLDGCGAWFKRVWDKKVSPSVDKTVKSLERRSEVCIHMLSWFSYSPFRSFTLVLLSQHSYFLYLLWLLQLWSSMENWTSKFVKHFQIWQVIMKEWTDIFLVLQWETLYLTVIGNVILQYAFVVMYANMIIEYFKALSTIYVNFLFFVAFCTASIVWNIIGAIYTKNTLCVYLLIVELLNIG